MPAYSRLAAVGLIAAAFLGFLRLPVIEYSYGSGDGRPRLVVMIVFDQMRGDYLKKWEPLFVDGGFKRLQAEGAWFTNCHYPYAYTLTAPGHTSLSTGTYPAKHGIIGNEWYDRERAAEISSVTPPAQMGRYGVGPYRRSARTLGDVLLDVLRGRCKIVSLSIKDRSAIMMAARRAHAVYWFDAKSGNFVTSPFYRDVPHDWVKSFNKSRLADRWIDKDWVRCRPDLDYSAYTGPDDVAAEGYGHDQGNVFPHPTKMGTGKEPMTHYYEAMELTPYGNDLLFEFAKTAIVAEKLGQTDRTDLLCVSFSSNDLVGHCWGPDSQEVLDITLRSDQMIAELLSFLDAKVGKGRYTVALSADHGVCPLPEVASLEGKNAGRVPPETLTSLANAHLNQTFSPSEKVSWIDSPTNRSAWIYLNRGVIKALKLEQSKVERALADWLEQQPGIMKAFTRTEMMAAPKIDDSELVKMMRRSFRPESSGDVMTILQPYHLYSAPLEGKNLEKLRTFRTTHGTPHPYDTHVPLLVMGPGIAPGQYADRVAPQAMASILAEVLSVPAPNGDEFAPPKEVFRGK